MILRSQTTKRGFSLKASFSNIVHLLFFPKRSEWVPVLVISKTNSVSFWSHTKSQLGVIWHSQYPSYCPWRICGWYFGGRHPSAARMLRTSISNCSSQPRLRQRFSDRLNLYIEGSISWLTLLHQVLNAACFINMSVVNVVNSTFHACLRLPSQRYRRDTPKQTYSLLYLFNHRCIFNRNRQLRHTYII